jgi:energy-coupling factor transporter transmembrane protein EcfT
MFFKRFKWWSTILTLVVGIVGAYLIKTYIMGLLIILTEYIFWGFSILYESLPEALWLFVFLILLLLIAFTNFPLKNRKPQKFDAINYHYPDRVSYWKHWIILSEKSQYYRWRLNRILVELAINVLSEQEHVTNSQMREMINNGVLKPPQKVLEYLQKGLNSYQFKPSDKSRWFWKKEKQSSSAEAQINLITEYLEKRKNEFNEDEFGAIYEN